MKFDFYRSEMVQWEFYITDYNSYSAAAEEVAFCSTSVHICTYHYRMYSNGLRFVKDAE